MLIDYGKVTIIGLSRNHGFQTLIVDTNWRDDFIYHYIRYWSSLKVELHPHGIAPIFKEI